MTADELNQLKNEMREDMKEETYLESRMHRDIEYAVGAYITDIEEAYRILSSVSNSLSSYGHEVSPCELLKLV